MATVECSDEVRVDRETFQRTRRSLVHSLRVGSLGVRSQVDEAEGCGGDAKDGWWRSYLAGEVPQSLAGEASALKSVDLFCGPGGLATGVRQLAAELGAGLIADLIVDEDEEALDVYTSNHEVRRRSSTSVSSLVDFGIRRRKGRAEFLYPPDLVASRAAEEVEAVDLVMAGPPCQGHSNLNNHTRRDDPRNGLYLAVPAFTLAVRAPVCIIENVPAVLHDSESVVEVAEQLFNDAGYQVETGVLSLARMGWPQRRRRHFMIARRDAAPIPLKVVAEVLEDAFTRSLWWAISDLEDVENPGYLDEPSELSPANVARIDWLFENDEYELALPERPESHRNGTTYRSVYGRLRRDEPSPTITTGFMSPGRGRYVHPTRRRGLTAHEAARLQGFPDSYRFVADPSRPPSRSKLAKWIGDAVPMPLGYAAALSAFGAGLPLRRDRP